MDEVGTVAAGAAGFILVGTVAAGPAGIIAVGTVAAGPAGIIGMEVGMSDCIRMSMMSNVSVVDLWMLEVGATVSGL